MRRWGGGGGHFIIRFYPCNRQKHFELKFTMYLIAVDCNVQCEEDYIKVLGAEDLWWRNPCSESTE